MVAPAMANKIEFWKAKREARRLVRQLVEIPRHITSRFLSAPYYDLVHARKVQVTAGNQSSSNRIAIYLIFPRDGVLQSHVHALEWLVANGIAPVVVSNVALSDAALKTLAPVSWKIVQRPNIGYDFGGYREGVLTISDHLASAEQLLLLNDSAWFPLPGSKEWLDQVDALGADYVGAATNYGMPRAKPENYAEQVWAYRSTHPNFHYTSYALSIGANILHDPKFIKFWRRFPMSDDKKRTVRRGEIGLSKWVMQHQYTHAATFPLETLDKDLAILPQDKLYDIAQKTMVPQDPHLLRVKREVLAKTPDARDLVQFILMATARQGMSYALQAYTIREKGFPFLKKSPLWLNEDARNITLELTSNLDGVSGRMIHDEAKTLGQRNTAFAPIEALRDPES